MTINDNDIRLAIAPAMEIIIDLEHTLKMNVASVLAPFMDDLASVDDIGEIIFLQTKMLAQRKKLRKKDVKAISKITKQLIKEVNDAVEELAFSHVTSTDEVYDKAKKAGIPVKTNVPNVTDDPAVIKAVNEAINEVFDKTNGTLNLMLKSNNKMYNDIVNTLTKSMVGGSTIDKAVKIALSHHLDDGLYAYIDAAGRHWKPSTYYEMVLRTNAKTAAVDAQFARANTRGNNLIEISSKADARPKCADDQGKIYDRSGSMAGKTTHEGDLIHAWSATSYGEADGILGINCGHESYDYVDGFSEKTFKPYDSEAVNEAYNDRVVSRYNERKIRQYKTQADVAGRIGLNSVVDDANARIQHWQAVQRLHVKESGIKRQYKREQI